MKARGRRLFSGREDPDYLTFIRSLPCAPHQVLGEIQRTPTEVEHFVHKSHGGYDRGDTYPTCGECRERRHVTMGPKAFTRLLLRHGLDERALCNRLAASYEAETWPCP